MTMLPDLSPLRLTTAQMESVRDALCDAIRLGLKQPDQEIRALPAYLGRPASDLSGRAVALDVGGTHMRAAWIALDRGQAKLLGPIEENALMERASRAEIGRDEFLAAQAELICAASPELEFDLGYCFSYPATITPEREAVLIEWTKGIRVADMVGQPVGRLLAEALARRGRDARALPVLNDTVATLLAGATLAPAAAHHIGVIVGTGTNMAGFFPVRDIVKLTPSERHGWREDAMMAVNLESGAFAPDRSPGTRSLLTPWDAALDQSLRPDERGKHHFEKAVSGAYLPGLLWQVAGRETCLKAGFDVADANTDAGTVAALRDHAVLGAAATAILDRSADLIAAGLAGLIQTYGAKDTAILVEGSLYHKTPGYAERVTQRLRELAPQAETRFISPGAAGVPVNFLGAASAALSPL